MLAIIPTPLYNESTTQEVINVADQHLLKVLQQGSGVWNTWRQKHPITRPDLSHANLNHTDLSHADLGYATLSRADLSHATLSHANLNHTDLSDATLSDANLNGAYLINTDLSRATLNYATLSHAKLSDATLSHATLRGTDLSRAELSRADLSYADLSHATVEWTHFDNIDLRTVRGLDTVQHTGPSYISIDTIYRSEGHIPETFLRKAGVPEDFLTYMRSLVAHPIEYYTCFISVRLVSPKHAKAWGWAGKEYSFHN